MGSVLAIMGAYYLLNGQAVRAAKEVAEWINEKLPESTDNKKQ